MLSHLFDFKLRLAERDRAQGVQQSPDDPPAGPHPRDEDPAGGNVIRLMPRPAPQTEPAPPPDDGDDPGPRAA
jgi:hypothetical protein